MRWKAPTTVVGTAIATYLLDPDQGKRRRNHARDRIGGFVRGRARRAERVGRFGASYAGGMVERAKATARPDQAPGDDRTLKSKIETELFRPADAPKGSVNIDVVDGVVTLRGQVKRPEDVREMEAQVRRFAGVGDVINLLHTPGTPAPNVPA